MSMTTLKTRGQGRGQGRSGLLRIGGLVCLIGFAGVGFATPALAQAVAIPLSYSQSDGGGSSVTVTGLPTLATGDATVSFRVHGDLDSVNQQTQEWVEVRFDGVLIGTLGPGLTYCGGPNDVGPITIAQATLAPMVTDGEIVVTYQAMPQVDAYCRNAALGAPAPYSYAVTGAISYPGTDATALAAAEIGQFAEQRARALLQNQPDVLRFVDGRSGGHLAAGVTRGRGTLDFASGAQGPFWVALSGSRSEVGTSDQSYALASVGTHLSFGANAVLGAMLQADHASQSFGSGDEVSGTGWLVGPYFAAQIPGHPLYVEGRLLYGTTDNRLETASGATGSFGGDRLLASFGVEGRMEGKGIDYFPRIRLSHVRESLDAFTDSAAGSHAATTVSLTEAELGLGFEMPLTEANGLGTLTWGLSGIYSERGGSGAAASVPLVSDGWRGRVDAGYRFVANNGLSFGTSVFYDGIGQSDADSYGAQLTLDFTF